MVNSVWKCMAYILMISNILILPVVAKNEMFFKQYRPYDETLENIGNDYKIWNWTETDHQLTHRVLYHGDDRYFKKDFNKIFKRLTATATF